MKLADRTVPIVLTIAAKEQALSGTIDDATGASVAIEKITLEDRTIRFNVRGVSFEGTIDGDVIRGKMRPAGTWIVKRGKADARTPDRARAEFYVQRGLAYRDAAQLDKAIADFTTALPLDPNNPTIPFARATAYFLNEDYKNAVADLTRAIALDPNNPIYYRWRAKAYKALDMIDEAVADELKSQ